jgi:signal transduction histidine kinase
MNPNSHGLGLNISKEIAQILKGDLTCISKFGVGSQFTFTMEAEEISQPKNKKLKRKKK